MLFLGLVLIQLTIFGVLVFFLRIVLTRNITTATTHLHELNQDYNQKLDEAKKRQMEVDKYYDEVVLKSKFDAEKTKVQILKEAHETQEAMTKEARKQSEEIIAQASRAKEMLLEEINEKINERAVEKACEMVQAILPDEAGHEMHTRRVREFFKNSLDRLERLNVPEEMHEAEVFSAYPLTSEEKTTLAGMLKEKLHREIRLSEKVSPELIAGFRVVLSTVVIDGSLNFRIREFVRHARTKQP
jgi:F0F1-type ATP synthase membrane subunit b/b'